MVLKDWEGSVLFCFFNPSGVRGDGITDSRFGFGVQEDRFVVYEETMGSPVDLTLGHHHHHNNNYAAAKNVDRKAEEYLRALEDERRKIEGFKRELPLCIQLLDDGKDKAPKCLS